MPNHESLRRRTLAIISHPDAGKTTLTEKLLLYAGAIQLAGSVSARGKERGTTSDWMEIERKRGISISSTVLQFECGGLQVNLLDTPGHKDFSEDTYRVLTAVDSVIMVLDAAKGIESQTLKLFEICRLRQIPIFTFINKLDRPALDPLQLLDQIDKMLQLHSYPLNWPLGAGEDFKGVYDRRKKQVHFFERVAGGAYRAPVDVVDLSHESIRERVHPDVARKAVEDLALLDEVGGSFDRAAVAAGDLTPVFFGSAVNNFGVELLLRGFLELAPPPRPQAASIGPIAPDDPRFSGFVFKIQANMDPRHRDQLAFVRVCSGRFERDMKVTLARTGEAIRLASSHKVFGRDRETVDEAFAGDIVGVVGHSQFRIGDTLTQDPRIVFKGVPRFPPEHFAYARCANTLHYKRFRTGLEHLLLEGVVQSFTPRGAAGGATLLGAVGPLQFEVLKHRIESEYGAEMAYETPPWSVVRWIGERSAAEVTDEALPLGSRLGEDADGRPVVFFVKEWDCQYFLEKHPKAALSKLPPGANVIVPV